MVALTEAGTAGITIDSTLTAGEWAHQVHI